MARRRWLTQVHTALALGIANIARVATYRLLLRAGMHPAQRIKPLLEPVGPFFVTPLQPRALMAPAWASTGGLAFGWIPVPQHTIPDWHRSVLTGERSGGQHDAWWKLADFDPVVGDIKGVWELSRFDWVVTLAQLAATGDTAACEQLNAWIASWIAENPAYLGRNWKCAQEASMRVLHLALAALVLEQVGQAAVGLRDLVRMHLARIAPTVAYAIGQQNNHGTSEAAALFIGGTWLDAQGDPNGAAWARAGRALLCERAAHLIQADGSFSQYSSNYHRLVLDTLSLAEVWRRVHALPEFGAEFVVRARCASEWLYAIVDERTGDVPNLGANDGANLLRLTDAAYRDFRPSVHLAEALFADRVAYPGNAVAATHLAWLDVPAGREHRRTQVSALYDDGGVAILRRGTGMALVRYPRFHFRPAHADALHVDLWVAGTCVLRDAGTCSYAGTDAALDVFAGALGHNTVQFDRRQQMPRLGRFLWGDWVMTEARSAIVTTDESSSFVASYIDAYGSRHQRSVELAANRMRVADAVSSFDDRAVVRWRLEPGAWQLDGHHVSSTRVRISVHADVPIAGITLTDAWESSHYGVKSVLPVLEIEVLKEGTIVSEFDWLP